MNDYQVRELEEIGHAEHVRWLRMVGVGFLGFYLADILQSMLPPRFMDAAWEWQLLGAAIERLPVMLLGFVFLFHGSTRDRGLGHLRGLWVTRWLLLATGVVFALVVPLLAVNAVRLDRISQRNIDARFNADRTELEQRLKRVDAIQLGQPPPAPEGPLPEGAENPFSEFLARAKSLDDAKRQAKTRLTALLNVLPEREARARKEERMSLVRTLVKWELVTLAGSLLFFVGWRRSRWISEAYRSAAAKRARKRPRSDGGETEARGLEPVRGESG